MGVDSGLAGVPETALWTLYHRAREAAHPRTVLPDPTAIGLLLQFDFPFAERFGAGFPGQSQILALRARCFDDEVRGFLAVHPRGTVVALGEGFETSFWRVDNGMVRWLTVDLPASVALRQQLLPHDERLRVHAGSAFDLGWMDDVDPADGVLITAQGLLMYFPQEQARDLIAACAARFPGARMVFDTISPLVNREAVERRGYRPPPLRWQVAVRDYPRLRSAHPPISRVREVRSSNGRGLSGWIAAHLRLLPAVGRDRPAIASVTFV
jgi:O-methyltransferase involved in polyketide biosynthesis